jgi:hypothetical protein
VAHLPRGCRWEHVGPTVQSAENKAVDCAFAIAAHPCTNGPLTDQITLPLRHSGLGFARNSPAEGDAAYLAAAATTQLAMRGGPTLFRPFNEPSGEQLRSLWETLHDTAVGLWPPEDREASPDTMGIIAEAQRALSRHSTQARADALLASFPPGTEHGKRARARLLSCVRRLASAWLDTLPLSRALELKSGEFHTGLRHRLDLAVLPPNAPDVQCGCGVTLGRTDADHGMRCSALAAQTTLRHDILKGILRCAVHRAGIASTLEPTLRRLPGLTDGPGMSANGSPSRLGARGGILMAMPQGVAIADVSVIHPLSINSLSAAAASPGAAAAGRDYQKRIAYAGVEPNGYAFVPFSVESHRRIGQPAMKLLHQLGDEAAGPGGIAWASFVAGTLRELSVGLCRGNFLMYRASGGMFARVSGIGFQAGLAVPMDEAIE